MPQSDQPVATTKTKKHVSETVLPSKKGSEDPNFSQSLIDVKPEDRPIDPNLADTGQHIVAHHAMSAKRGQAIGCLSHVKDTANAMLHGFDAVLKHGADAWEAPVVDKGSGDGVLLIGPALQTRKTIKVRGAGLVCNIQTNRSRTIPLEWICIGPLPLPCDRECRLLQQTGSRDPNCSCNR